MITVRFPNGYSLQYNAAAYVEYMTAPHRARLRTRKNGPIVAIVYLSTGALIEFEKPCRAYDAMKGPL